MKIGENVVAYHMIDKMSIKKGIQGHEFSWFWNAQIMSSERIWQAWKCQWYKLWIYIVIMFKNLGNSWNWQNPQFWMRHRGLITCNGEKFGRWWVENFVRWVELEEPYVKNHGGGLKMEEKYIIKSIF